MKYVKYVNDEFFHYMFFVTWTQKVGLKISNFFSIFFTHYLHIFTNNIFNIYKII